MDIWTEQVVEAVIVQRGQTLVKGAVDGKGVGGEGVELGGLDVVEVGLGGKEIVQRVGVVIIYAVFLDTVSFMVGRCECILAHGLFYGPVSGDLRGEVQVVIGK